MGVKGFTCTAGSFWTKLKSWSRSGAVRLQWELDEKENNGGWKKEINVAGRKCTFGTVFFFSVKLSSRTNKARKLLLHWRKLSMLFLPPKIIFATLSFKVLCYYIPLFRSTGVQVTWIILLLVSKWANAHVTPLDMPNFFRERLAPLIYSNDLRTKLALIHWLQRKRLLKRNVNCSRCLHRMNLNICRRKPDGYQW